MSKNENDEGVEEVAGDGTGEVAIAREKIGGEVPILVSRITDKALYSGFFGTLDSARMQRVIEKVLNMLTEDEIEIIIIDLSNIDILDSDVAAHLIMLGETIAATGSKAIFCGIKPAVAQTMSASGIGIDKLMISKDLRAALKEVFRFQGLELVDIKGEGKCIGGSED